MSYSQAVSPAIPGAQRQSVPAVALAKPQGGPQKQSAPPPHGVLRASSEVGAGRGEDMPPRSWVPSPRGHTCPGRGPGLTPLLPRSCLSACPPAPLTVTAPLPHSRPLAAAMAASLAPDGAGRKPALECPPLGLGRPSEVGDRWCGLRRAGPLAPETQPARGGHAWPLIHKMDMACSPPVSLDSGVSGSSCAEERDLQTHSLV